MKEEGEKVVEKRLDKVKIWLKNPYNLTLIGILLFAFTIRLYYLIITNNQPLWWDEAEYMATAKHWAFGVPYELNPQRLPLFQLIATIPLLFGLGETFIKFTLVLLPSVFLVFAIYLLGKEMFNKKVGLIAAFLTTVSWTFIFWTPRVQPDFFSMIFQVLSVLFIWRYWKDNKSKYMIFAGIFAALGLHFKISALLLPLIFFIFILIKDRLSAFKNKDNYYFLIAYLATMVPYFIWSYLNFKTFTAFTYSTTSQIINKVPFAWYNINWFYVLAEGALFILFLAGLVISLKFIFYLDILAKDKKKCFDSGLFSLIVFVCVTAFYIFWIRGGEDRHVFLILPFIFILIGNAAISIYNFGKKYSKILSVILVLALLIWGAYAQLNHASEIIKSRQGSYMPVKEAALWIKENSLPTDIVMTKSRTQTTYYAERGVKGLSDFENASAFDEYLKENKPRFLELSIFENHPSWAYPWPNEDNSKIVQAYFIDAEQKQPALIIYELKY